MQSLLSFVLEEESRRLVKRRRNRRGECQRKGRTGQEGCGEKREEIEKRRALFVFLFEKKKLKKRKNVEDKKRERKREREKEKTNDKNREKEY